MVSFLLSVLRFYDFNEILSEKLPAKYNVIPIDTQISDVQLCSDMIML